MKPITPCLRGIFAVAVPVLVSFLAAASASQADIGRIRNTPANNKLIVIALTEQNLPSEQLTPAPSGSASPSASPAPSGMPASSPTPAATSTGAPAEGGVPGNTAPAGNAAAQGQLTPAPSPADIPPPLELSNVPLTPPISDFSLKPLVQSAATPALGASLRITEDARQQIAAGRADHAIRTLSHAVSIDPANAYAYFYLGRAWLMKKDYKQALIFFARAEMGFGSNPPWLGETLGFEGVCYEELGQSREAVMAYERALQATPGNLMARTGYGRLAASLQPAAEPSPAAIEPAPGETIKPAPAMPPPPPPPVPGTSSDERYGTVRPASAG
ncbi:MAG: tetratricopeptide repeat protein [Candidatus Binataceae bacterium]